MQQVNFEFPQTARQVQAAMFDGEHVDVLLYEGTNQKMTPNAVETEMAREFKSSLAGRGVALPGVRLSDRP
jgi:hypothetical protein